MIMKYRAYFGKEVWRSPEQFCKESADSRDLFWDILASSYIYTKRLETFRSKWIRGVVKKQNVCSQNAAIVSTQLQIRR